MVDPTIALAFQPYLTNREVIRWTGKPRRGLMFHRRDAFLVPFSLVWLAFVVFWEWQVLRSDGGLFMTVWGAGFFAIGLMMFAGRFFVDAWVRGRTLYAMTDERALVLRRVFSERLLTSALADVNVEKRRDGSGTLGFGPDDPFPVSVSVGFWRTSRGNSSQWSYWMPALSDRVRFLGIPDVMFAYGLAMANRAAP